MRRADWIHLAVYTGAVLVLTGLIYGVFALLVWLYLTLHP